jgi:hypothetical protein
VTTVHWLSDAKCLTDRWQNICNHVEFTFRAVIKAKYYTANHGNRFEVRLILENDIEAAKTTVGSEECLYASSTSLRNLEPNVKSNKYYISSWRMVSSGMLRRMALVITDVSEELSPSFTRVARVGELGTMLAVTSNRRTLRRNTKWY